MREISVIVPVYKVEKTLRACVDSILAQTFWNFELILVDDGSPDTCPLICDEYAKKESRVRVVHQPNQGLAAARNRGVKEAVTKWIHFVDSDDVIHPQMLECLYNAIKRDGTSLAMCSVIEAECLPDTFFETKQLISKIIICDEDMLLHCLQEGDLRYSVAWAKLIDKSIVQKYPFTEGRFYEDSPAVCKWLCEVKRASTCDAAMYFYRVNLSGISKGTFSTKHLDRLWAYGQQVMFFQKRGYKRVLQMLCDGYMWVAHEYYLKTLNDLKRPDLARKIAKDALRIYRQNKNVITLTDKQICYIMETMFPKRMAIYWKWKAVIGRIKKIFHRGNV